MPSGEDALEMLDRSTVDLLLTDHRLPGIDGVQLITRIKAIRPTLAAIVMTAYGTIESAVEARRQGADGYLEKPFAMPDLLVALHGALEQQRSPARAACSEGLAEGSPSGRLGGSGTRTGRVAGTNTRCRREPDAPKGEYDGRKDQVPKDFRRVVVAAAVGNIIEWYDFYIFGSLAAILSVKFFDKTHPVAALLSTIALFTAGFLIRPLGAFLFGWLGDRVGRKYTFIVTLTGMGLATAAIGLIPTFASIGVAAAFILFGLRMIQGLCLGGEYGGAITYVAEHVSDERRGYYTGWLQTSPTLGIVVSLAVIVGTRTYLGNDAFNDWGWRIPFLISFLLVMMAIYIRLQLGETPIFQEMKAKGGMVRNPWKEAFLSSNIKFILVAIVVLIGQGVVWYSGQFWALYFLQTVKKLDVLTSSYIVGAALLIASPTLILFGWLSDIIGRKPVILGGMRWRP